MDIHISIRKQHLYVLLLIMIALAGLVLVSAIGSNDPTFHGHDSGELSVEWGSINNRPSGLDDGDQVGITSESDPQVGSVSTSFCKGDGSAVQCNSGISQDGSGNLVMGFRDILISGSSNGIFFNGNRGIYQNGNLLIGDGFGTTEIQSAAIALRISQANTDKVVCFRNSAGVIGVCSTGVTGSGTCTCV